MNSSVSTMRLFKEIEKIEVIMEEADHNFHLHRLSGIKLLTKIKEWLWRNSLKDGDQLIKRLLKLKLKRLSMNSTKIKPVVSAEMSFKLSMKWLQNQ